VALMADPQHVTLVANTVKTITLDADANRVNILNVDGAAAVYVTVDGTAPTVGGDGAWVLPAAICDLELEVTGPGNTVVKLISSGTPRVSVGTVS
jgi:hypothetical protein